MRYDKMLYDNDMQELVLRSNVTHLAGPLKKQLIRALRHIEREQILDTAGS